jgi:hypothetical protein
MNMTRRTFILSTGLVAAAPSLASMLTTSPKPGSSMLPSAGGLQSDLPVTKTAGYDLPFRIDGWEPREKMAPDERMWISINQSWRAAWR